MGQLSLEGYISSFETLQPDNARENEASESFSAPCADPPRAKLQILHPFARVNTSHTLAPSSLLARPSQRTKNDFGVQQEHGTLVRPNALFADRVQEVFQTRAVRDINNNYPGSLLFHAVLVGIKKLF